MYCTSCGSALAIRGTYCSACGARLTSKTSAASISVSRDNWLRNVRLLVGIVCAIVAIVLIVMLQPVAALIGIIVLAVLAVGWSRPSIRYGHKVSFVIFSIALLVSVETVELHRARHLAIERQRIDAQKEAAIHLKAQQAEDAFNKMTPAQHLSAAKNSLRVDAFNTQIAEGMKHLAALRGTNLETEGVALRRHMRLLL